MATITLPKTEYETLKRQASLCEEIFRYLPERVFGIENYSKKRINEFLKEDKLFETVPTSGVGKISKNRQGGDFLVG